LWFGPKIIYNNITKVCRFSFFCLWPEDNCYEHGGTKIQAIILGIKCSALGGIYEVFRITINKPRLTINSSSRYTRVNLTQPYTRPFPRKANAKCTNGRNENAHFSKPHGSITTRIAVYNFLCFGHGICWFLKATHLSLHN